MARPTEEEILAQEIASREKTKKVKAPKEKEKKEKVFKLKKDHVVCDNCTEGVVTAGSSINLGCVVCNGKGQSNPKKKKSLSRRVS